MMTKLRDYEAWKLKKLSNPIFAAHYLNEVEKSSPELVLAAIQNVVRAREVSAVAKEAGIARENIYRAFKEQGNPTITTFREVIKAVGLKFHFEPIGEATLPPTAPPSVPGIGSRSSETLQQSLGGALGNTGDALASSRLVRVRTNPPELGGIGQQQKALRSAHGRNEEALSAAH